jgi:pyruvate dehydrogenase E2 component (dihydrolipoamide acetyltransferase)
MPFTVTMPKLSPTMESGTIAKWHKKVGDKVTPGDLLLEISTDKATVEHEALDGGWLRQVLAKEGAEVDVNQPIAVLSETADENVSEYVPVAVASADPTKVRAAPAAPKPTPQPQSVGKSLPPTPPPQLKMDRVAASPLARKLARDQGIDLRSVKGTGPGQRVMSRDLDQLQPAPSVGFSHREPPPIAAGTYQEIPLNPVRKVIARRLQEAKSTIPHFYVRQTVNAEPLVAARAQLENAEIKLTFNDFILRACALALRDMPTVNSGFDAAQGVVMNYQTIDISVAVTVPDGLITPIVRHADYKNLSEISTEVKTLSRRAKEGKLQPEEYQGGSFTLSNLGMFGIDDFVAVINPPQAAILAVGAIREVPVVRQGMVLPGKELAIVLSADHRVIDGSLAAQFVRQVQHYVENPALLLI